MTFVVIFRDSNKNLLHEYLVCPVFLEFDIFNFGLVWIFAESGEEEEGEEDDDDDDDEDDDDEDDEDDSEEEADSDEEEEIDVRPAKQAKLDKGVKQNGLTNGKAPKKDDQKQKNQNQQNQKQQKQEKQQVRTERENHKSHAMFAKFPHLQMFFLQ